MHSLLLDPFVVAHWDKLVLVHPQALIFHSVAWARVVFETYRHVPLYLGRMDRGELNSVLPIVEVNSWLTGRRGVSLPFSDFCGPLVDGQAGGRGLLKEAIELGHSRGWNYFEWRSGEMADDAAPSAKMIGHRIDLDDNEEGLFARLGSSVRRAVRKAEKLGVRVRFLTDLRAVRTYYRLHCLTRRKHGLPPQPFSFFKKIHEHIISKGLGFVALARRGDPGSESIGAAPAPLEGGTGRISPESVVPEIETQSSSSDDEAFSGAIFFQFGTQALYKFGAGDPRFQELRGNNLIMWRAIQQFRAKGLKVLHLGRTLPRQEGLRRYKLGFGAKEQPIRYFSFDLKTGTYRVPRDLSDGWHNPIFRILPCSMNRVLGELMYPHLD